MLTRKQKAAIEALATTTTQTEAAEKAGVARRSVHGWLKETEFKQALLERERDLRNEAARRVAVGNMEALNVLYSIFTNERNDAGLRRLAAKDWLMYSNATDAMLDLDLRITQLEMNYENRK